MAEVQQLALGRTLMTQGVHEWTKQKPVNHLFALACLDRHSRCDWGDLCLEDQHANEQALLHNSRVMSVYTDEWTQTKIWIITEADRSATTILLPKEY